MPKPMEMMSAGMTWERGGSVGPIDQELDSTIVCKPPCSSSVLKIREEVTGPCGTGAVAPMPVKVPGPFDSFVAGSPQMLCALG